jgi:peptide/nickel transport system ATP-binding protein
MCENLAIMHNSRFVEYGTRRDIYDNATHIYTRRLIAAIPDIDPRTRKDNARRRAEINALYEKVLPEYYRDNTGVYDLRPVSDTHYVAMK